MEVEDTEHDLVCPQGAQQLYPLDDFLAAIINVTHALAAYSNALLNSIFSASVEYPEVVRGLDALLTHSLYQGHRHRDPVLLGLEGGAAQHVGIKKLFCSLTCPAFKWVSNLDNKK